MIGYMGESNQVQLQHHCWRKFIPKAGSGELNSLRSSKASFYINKISWKYKITWNYINYFIKTNSIGFVNYVIHLFYR